MPSTTEPELRYQVALAGRILGFLGQTDAILGFVGARAADNASFWMKQMPMGLDEVYPGDLLRIDYDGNVIEGENTTSGCFSPPCSETILRWWLQSIHMPPTAWL